MAKRDAERHLARLVNYGDLRYDFDWPGSYEQAEADLGRPVPRRTGCLYDDARAERRSLAGQFVDGFVGYFRS